MTLKLVAIGGLGTMLGPSAKHLESSTAAKYIRILDRENPGEQREQRRQAWRAHGASLVNSLQALLAEGDFDGVVICAGKNGDDFEIFNQIVPMLKTLTEKTNRTYFILHLSTVSCDFARATADYCQQHQVQYANYPLTGGVKGAENAQMLILASGDEHLYQRLSPMLTSIGKPQYFGADVARGAAIKLIGHIMVFHGLLGISLAAVVHKNINDFAHLNPEQVPFFDFLNQGAGGTRQWDVALRASLLEGHWGQGFLIQYALIDAFYTVHLMLAENLPRMVILPLLEVILLFCFALAKQDQPIATQSIAYILAETPKEELDDFLKQHLCWDVKQSLENCVALLPERLRKILMLEVNYL